MVAQLEGVEEVLPTFLFILGAYAAYALLRLIFRRPAGGRRGSRPGRLPWISVAAGAGSVLCLMWLLATGAPENPGKDLRLAGIVGLPGEGYRQLQPEVRLEPPAPPLAAAAPPTFVLVHPETPAALMLPEKTSATVKPRPAKPKSLRAAASGKKVSPAKASPKEKTQGKDKGVAKNSGKSKKTGPAGIKTARTG
ncbi:MAG: hypothetical protein K6T55_02120 [Syntrophobacterales bacterium]|nr:hypothetical protein [Syntrophobacterales bacterium]